GVDGVFEFEDFPLDVHRDLAGEVASGDGGGHGGDVTDLCREVAGHGVDAVGQVLPGAGDALDFGLAAELAFGADFAGHAGDFLCKGTELLLHGVDGVFELQNFTANVHGDFLGEIAIGHRDGDVGDVADLRGQVCGHGVDA